ncbi:MAG TPA: peptidase E [Bacillales bacterium]|nr:peptidase E [Bacillales bacterium]
MRQIIAMGGGGFSMEPENPLLDRYILAQTARKQPRVCFVPTASGDAEGYIDQFYIAFRELFCKPSHLSLFKPPSQDLEDYVLDKDVIYVGGGNTKNMLVLWREWGLDIILQKAWESGVLLAGLSAGSICWYEEGVSDSLPGEYSRLEALGFLPGSHSPHYDGEPERRGVYHKLIAEGMSDGLAADDGVALHYVDRELHKVVSSRPQARAYLVAKTKDSVSETEMVPEYLGDDQ